MADNLRDVIEGLTAYQARLALRRMMVYGHHNDVRRAIHWSTEERSYYELQPEDVGKRSIHAFGESWSVVGFIGRILATDVGKRVYVKAGILSVENDEQLKARRERSNS